MTLQSIGVGTALGAAIASIAFGATLEVRRWVRIHRLVNCPLKSQAPAEPIPTAYEQEWLDYGHDRDDAPNVVEDDELLDAFVTDPHCAELEEWPGLGGPALLVDTPENLKRLAAL